MGPTFIVQQYTGEPRPKEQVAVLRMNGKEPVRLMTLDDQDVAAPILEPDFRLHIEVLPGRHTLTVKTTAAPADSKGGAGVGISER